MIDIKEIISNTNNINIIDPFTFKYLTLNLTNEFSLKFKLNNKFFHPQTEQKYYKESYFTISINKYIQILQKIFNNSKSICHKCNKESSNNFCCNLCHEWFCSSCCELHLKENLPHDKSLKEINLNVVYNYFTEEAIKEKENELLKKKLFKMKFLTEDDFQKNWNICECEKGGGEAIYYCNHGLKCENCLCEGDLKFRIYDGSPFKELRFIYLDIIFLESEIKNYDVFEHINNDIDKFNNNIGKLFVDNINNIKNNKARQKRFKKHFNVLRNNFISYQKLKFILINILKKEPNYHLIQLYQKMKYFKLCFKKYEYNKNLTLDENISKISNFFATQKPIYFYDYLKERSLKNIKPELGLISESAENKNKNGIYDKFIYPETYLKEDIKFNNSEECKKYIKLMDVFKFAKRWYYWLNNGKIQYSIKFKKEDINYKLDLFYENGNCHIQDINCIPTIKLSNYKWIFLFQKDSYWNKNNWFSLVNLIDEIDHIFEIEFVINTKKLNELVELKNPDKYLMYQKVKYDYHKKNEIVIIDIKHPKDIIHKKFQNKYIENIFSLNNYENTVLIFLANPLLNLLIFDYELNQVNTIIDLINPFIPLKDMYGLRPYIYQIKELNNKNIIFFGSQRYIDYCYPDFNKYEFKILFNYEKQKIEIAENRPYYDDYFWD